MKFLIDSKELTAGVLSVIKAIPVRTTMQILEGIYIEAAGSTVKLKCSDLMLEKECLLPATIEEEGKAIVPAKLFSEVMRRLPDALAEVTIAGKSVDIACGRVQMSIQTIDYEEFPEMRFTGDTFTVKMDREECRDLILQTVFATAQDDSKPILTGVLLELGDCITAVATDAYQFAMRKVPLEAPTPEKSTVIPAKSLLEIARMMDETDQDAELTFTRTHVKVDIGHTCLTARLLDGQLDIHGRDLERLPQLCVHHGHRSRETALIDIARTDGHRLVHDVHRLLLDVAVVGGRGTDLGPQAGIGAAFGILLHLHGLIGDLDRRILAQRYVERLFERQHQRTGHYRIRHLLRPSRRRRNAYRRRQRKKEISQSHKLRLIILLMFSLLFSSVSAAAAVVLPGSRPFMISISRWLRI